MGASTLSVAMCTYNGELYLRQQLESIAAQTRPPDELVVCDDGSTDATVAILNDFAADAPFPVRVRVNPTNLGTRRNFERAIALATGAIIALADQDDVWYPPKLERLERALARSERIGFVFSDADVVDDRLRPVGYRLWEALGTIRRNRRLIARGRLFEALIRGNIVTGCTAAFRADYKDLVLPIPEEWTHDAWIAFLIAAVAEVARIEEPLLAHRQHAGNQTGLGRYNGKKRATARPVRKRLCHAKRQASRLRAAYESLNDKQDAFPITQDRLHLLGAAIAHVERRSAILAESSLPRRLMMASREFAGLRYARYSEGLRQYRKDVLVRTWVRCDGGETSKRTGR